MRRGPRVVVMLAVVAVLASACTSGGGDRLTIYSGRNEELIGPLLSRFAKESGIDIEVRYGDSADLALLVDTEGERSPADVFLSQSPGSVDFLDGKQRLVRLPRTLLDRVPEGDHSDSGTWVGLSGRVRTLVYNTKAVKRSELPRSVFDLVGPSYKGRLGVAPGNASFQDFVTVMRTERGEDETRDWLAGLAANDAKPYPNNIAIVEAVGRGEIDLGLVNHYYNEQAKAEDSDVASENYFFPAGDLGSLLLVTAATIVDSASHRDEAVRFIEFLLSKDAQEYFARETKEFPLARGVSAPEGLPPLEDLPLTRTKFERLGGLERTEELISDSGLED